MDNVLRKEELFWEEKNEFEWLSKKSIKKILLMMPEPSGSVLELCAGSGMFTKFLSFIKVKRYVCLDISKRLLNSLKLKVPSVEIIKGDAQSPPFSRATFDIVYIFAGLHHLPNLEVTISNVYNVLKQNGKFVCFEPNADCFYRFIIFKLKRFLFNFYTEDEIFLKAGDIERLLKKSGFKNIKTEYITPNYKLHSTSKILLPFAWLMKAVSFIPMPKRNNQTFFIITGDRGLSIDE